MANVNQMYGIIYDEIVEAKFAKQFEGDELVYNDRYRNLVSEKYMFEKLSQNSLIHSFFCLPT